MDKRSTTAGEQLDSGFAGRCNEKIIPITQFPLWEQAKLERTLLSVTFELTARCNNACSHCYINLPAGDKKAIKKELSFSEIREIVDEAVSLGTLWVLLSGGEPLLRPDFFEIYRYLKKKGLLVSIFTNAALVTHEHIRLFEKYPPRDIEVTVYGVTEDVHAKVTGKNTFSSTMAGLDRLLSAALPVTLKSTIMAANVHSFDEIANFCRHKSKAPFRFDPFLHLRLDGDSEKNKRIIAERLSPRAIRDIERHDAKRIEVLRQKCRQRDAEIFTENEQSSLFRCMAGINSCCVGYDGMLKLCSALNHTDCTYDLKKGTLTDAWNRFLPTVRNRNSSSKSYRENCGSCSLIDFCMWCPAHAYLETGKLDAHKDYFCEVAMERYAAVNCEPPIA